MQHPPLEKRLCACGCGTKFQPRNVRMIYSSDAHKQRAQRARKQANKRQVLRNYWPIDLKTADRAVYLALMAIEPGIKDTFWDVFEVAGMAVTSDLLRAVGFILAAIDHDDLDQQAYSALHAASTAIAALKQR